MMGKIEGRRRRGWQRMRWLDCIPNSNGHEFEQALGVGNGQGSQVCCSPWSHKESDITEQLSWTQLKCFIEDGLESESVGHSVMSNSLWPHGLQPTRLLCPWNSPGKNNGVGCHFLLQCMKVKSESEVAQSCLTLCDPMGCSLPGSSVHEIFQARVMEWGAIAFSESNVLGLKFSVLLLYSTSWRRQWQPTSVLLPGKSHGWRSLVGCSPWGC